jgi:two-component sensor histidine kinase
MVLNELLLNAVEHGLQGRSRGRITITLDDLGDAVRITVEDDGTGLPPDFDPTHHSSSLGLHIVHTLVTDDLKGSLHLQSRADSRPAEGAEAEQSGTRAIVTFPKRFMRIG